MSKKQKIQRYRVMVDIYSRFHNRLFSAGEYIDWADMPDDFEDPPDLSVFCDRGVLEPYNGPWPPVEEEEGAENEGAPLEPMGETDPVDPE